MRTIAVKVKPQARQSSLMPPAAEGEAWQAQLKSPPVDGKANAAIIKLLSKSLGIPVSSMEISSGQTSRDKTLLISGYAPEEISLP